MPDTPGVNFHTKKQRMKCLYQLIFSLKELRVQTEDALGRFRKRKKVFTEHSKASTELTLVSCYVLI